MLENIFAELEAIIAPMEHISDKHAEQMLVLANEKIEQKTNSYIIDVLRRPSGTDGTFLLPFVSSHGKSKRGPIPPEQITKQNTGVWPLVYVDKKPLWITNIIDLDRSKDTINHFDNTVVKKKYLSFTADTDEILVIPLTFEGNFMGIYSIEFPKHCTIARDIAEELVHLTHLFSEILWKTEVAHHFEVGVNHAIDRFRNAISIEPCFTLSDHKDGFFARPFRAECEQIEDHVKKYFSNNGVRVSSYNHTPGSGVVIHEIIDKIESSHFGIVDLTDYNSNVIIELGMLQALKKKTIYLMHEKHTDEPPFNLKPFHHYTYKVIRDEIKVKHPPSVQLKSIDNVLKEFLSELLQMPTFKSATSYPIGS